MLPTMWIVLASTVAAGAAALLVVWLLPEPALPRRTPERPAWAAVQCRIAGGRCRLLWRWRQRKKRPSP